MGISPPPRGPEGRIYGVFCLVVTFLASRFRESGGSPSGSHPPSQRDRPRGERRGPDLGVRAGDEGLDLEGILGWTIEAAHAVAGGPYAHVAALKATITALYGGEFDVCPSWWHPRSNVSCCRAPAGAHRAQRRRDPRYRGLHAVTLGAHGDESWGRLSSVAGVRGRGGACPELLAAEVAPALKDAGRHLAGWTSSRTTEPRFAPPRSAAGALLRQAATILAIT